MFDTGKKRVLCTSTRLRTRGFEGRGNKLGLGVSVGKRVLCTSTRLRTRGFEGRGGRECVRVGERFLAPASSLFTGL